MTDHMCMVIANVNGRYRELASVYCPIAYREIFTICRRLLKIFEAKVNRLALEHELRWAEQLREQQWEDLTREIPFPFITTCLRVGTLYGRDEKRFEETATAPAVHFNQDLEVAIWDQNGERYENTAENITVLDITSITSPKYCFVCPDVYSASHPERAEFLEPLNARKALLRLLLNEDGYEWHHSEEEATEALEGLEGFEAYETVLVASLESAWPNVKWVEGDDVKEDDPVGLSLKAPLGRGPRSLRDIAMRASLDQVFECDKVSLENICEYAGQLSDFYALLKARIYRDYRLTSKSPNKIPLVHKVVREAVSDGIIDLSPFGLDENELSHILFEPIISIESLHTLSLSGNRHISQSLLKRILQTYPSIKTLHLLDVAPISFQAEVELCREYKIEEAYISEYFLAFNPVGRELDTKDSYIESPVSQMIFIACSERDGQDRVGPNPNGPEADLELKDLFYPRHERDNDSFDRCCGTIPLTDMNRPRSTVLDALGRFFFQETKGYRHQEDDSESIPKLLALCFASADLSTDEKITAVSGELFMEPDSYHDTEMTLQPHLDGLICPSPGKWTVAVLHELPPNWEWGGHQEPRIRYAFVTVRSVNSEGLGVEDIIIADAREFVNSFDEFDDDMKHKMLENWEFYADSVEFCPRGEIESLFRGAGWITREGELSPGLPIEDLSGLTIEGE